MALKLLFSRKPNLQKYASSILYRTLGKTLPKNAEAAAPLLGLTTVYAQKYFEAVKRVGYKGSKRTLGNTLFDAIVAGKSGFMRMHPGDAQELGLTNGSEVTCQSSVGSIKAVVEIDNSIRRKMVTLPNGYGLRYKNSEPVGPQINLLTPSNHCGPLTKTPYHKYLPVKITKVVATELAP